MLRRQQAEAIIAARKKIVPSALSVVEMALTGLSERHVVELDDAIAANMVPPWSMTDSGVMPGARGSAP